MKNKELKTRCDLAYYQVVSDRALAFGGISSYLRYVIDKDLASAKVKKPEREVRKIGNVPLLSTRLSLDEKKRFAALAASEGETMSSYSALLIRNSLRDDALLTKRECESLRGASMQLAAIGRNLNQVVAQLNSGYGNQGKISEKYLETLRSYVKGLDLEVKALVAKSSNRGVMSE